MRSPPLTGMGMEVSARFEKFLNNISLTEAQKTDGVTKRESVRSVSRSSVAPTERCIADADRPGGIWGMDGNLAGQKSELAGADVENVLPAGARMIEDSSLRPLGVAEPGNSIQCPRSFASADHTLEKFGFQLRACRAKTAIRVRFGSKADISQCSFTPDKLTDGATRHFEIINGWEMKPSIVQLDAARICSHQGDKLDHP
jgi:hypothetical protein